MKLEQIQQAMPQPIGSVVIYGVPVVSLFEVVNPILQAIAFLVAIAWGGMQMWGWLEKRRKSRKE